MTRALQSPGLFATIMLATLALTPAQAQVEAQASATDPAAAPIRALDDGLLAIMRGGAAMGVRGRAERIGPVVDAAFDLPLMTRLAVGPGWTGIAPADKTALTAAFRRMTIGQYAVNFDGFSGQSFTIDPKVEARGGDKLVRTILKGPKDAPVAISYRLRQSGGGQSGGGWRIIDVFYRNAISQLATRRSDFAGILQSGGARALVAHLDALATKSGG